MIFLLHPLNAFFLMEGLMNRRVAVIGSGVGGLAVAALLAKQGDTVSVFELHSFVGGRCSAFKREGFTVDFGVHMFSRGNSGPHGEVARRISADLQWTTHDPACRVMGVADFNFPLNINPLHRQIYLSRKLNVAVRNYWGAFRLFKALMANREVAEYDPVLLKNFIRQFTDDPAVHLFITCVCQLYFAISYLEASAGEFLWCFSRMFKNAAFGYPRGGCGRIPESFREALVKLGGQVKLNEGIERIVIEKQRVAGIETQSGFIPADVVISNIGLEETMNLAGTGHFDEEYQKTSKNLVYSNPYLTIKYALDSPVIPYPVVFHMPDMPADKVFDYINLQSVPEDPYIFMPVPSNMDPSLAPSGKQLVIAGTAAPRGADDGLCHAILDKVHEKICCLFPGFKKAIRWEMRTTRMDVSRLTRHPRGEAIGLAQIPTQVGDLRPNHLTPVEGLYLVGADVGARGIGTEMASASALALADALSS
jgi:phytoene dehydrogenase-like protein